VSERADGLRRRRDLLKEELARVELQLSAEESGSANGAGDAPPVDPEALAEQILSQYRSPPAAVAGKAKSGCIAAAVFGIGLLLALAALGIFLYARSLHGH
jgi:hypothetical protein